MRLFQCQNCHNIVHFNNSACVSCGFRLGYIPQKTVMSAVMEAGDGWTALAEPGSSYYFCTNAADGVCNWLVSGDDPNRLCIACRHNRTIPDLTLADNWQNWQKLETAKHQLFYSLLQWKLPMPDRAEDPENGLVFDFVGDVLNPDGSVASTLLTGHEEGVITVNIAEADDAERERRRAMMREPYRTLLGHFRHEVGHYYWDRLVRDRGRLDDFRAIFGDESVDYNAALQRHYENGPPVGWAVSFISSYASSHPWEDFAETWAHYIHMVDALETARAFGINIKPRAANSEVLSTELDFRPYFATSMDQLIEAVVPLTVAINSINRSMGQPDFYPFVLSEPVIGKLRFIHGLVHGQ